MRAVVQRVVSASVTGESALLPTKIIVLIRKAVNNEIISQISRGLMVLVGIGTGPYFIREITRR